MEWAVCTASSDSEDSTTQERDEGEWAPSSTDQQGSLYEVAQTASTNDARGSVSFAFVDEAPSTRNGWNSRDSVKAGKKPPPKPIQDLTHFGKKDGNQVPVPHGMRSMLTVNISEEDGVSYSESEELVTERDPGDLTEELEFHNATAEFGVSQKEILRRSELQKKKRNYSEDGQGPASKLAKRSEQSEKGQMPCASTERGDGATDPARCQRSGSIQADPLEENFAAEEPINCTQRTEYFSPSSQEEEHGVGNTVNKSHFCFSCNKECWDPRSLHEHRIHMHSQWCPDCGKRFLDAAGLGEHRKFYHHVEKPYNCEICNQTFRFFSLVGFHRLRCKKAYDTKEFTVDEELDLPWEVRE